jgi:hypothetical protein
MYRLEMCTPNLKYISWWRGGKSLYKFDTIDELIDFMSANIPMTIGDMDFIYREDKKKQVGRLACTSWYTIEKGKRQMTEYTSF